MNFGIKNLRTDAGLTTLTIRKGIIQPTTNITNYFDGQGYWLLPGLINAHDHLGLDLLPHLGNPPYPNARAWGEAVYQPQASPLKEIYQLTYRERLWWGAYRNLLSGVTTVQHHDRGHWQLAYLPVSVPPYRWLHAPGSHLGGAYGWQSQETPLLIHCAEGTDTASYQEVHQLQQAGLLTKKTVLIHALALTPASIIQIKEAGSGVVVCPQSNQFLYGAIAPLEALYKAGITLALGTDSTTSGSDDLLAELRAARGLLSDAALLRMVTEHAAQLLGVPHLGRIAIGHQADFILIDAHQATTAAEALLTAYPKNIRLVVRRGKPKLVRSPFLKLAPKLNEVCVEGEPTWLSGPIHALLKKTQQILGMRRYFNQTLTLL